MEMHRKRRKPPSHGKRTYFSEHYLQFPATSTRYLEISETKILACMHACMQKKKFIGTGAKKKHRFLDPIIQISGNKRNEPSTGSLKIN